MTTARANQTTGLANGRAANWAPEVEFSPFRALSRRQMTFPFCCQISLVMNCQVGSYVDIRSPRLELSSSSIDHSADGRAYISTGKLQSMYIWISFTDQRRLGLVCCQTPVWVLQPNSSRSLRPSELESLGKRFPSTLHPMRISIWFGCFACC